MNLEIFDKDDKQRKDIVRTYDFVQYEDEFNGIGSFTITMPTNEESLQYLKFGNFILFEEGVVGIVKSIGDTEEDSTTFTIKGTLTNGILAHRSFLKTMTFYDTLTANARAMVSTLMLDSTDTNRYIDFVKLSEDEQYIPETEKIRIQDTGDKLNEVLTTMFLPYSLGYEMYPNIEDYDEESGKLANLASIEFRVLKPTDRTIDNTEGNPPVVFSFEMSNLKRMEYLDDGSIYNTIAIVAAEGTGQERKTIEVGESDKKGYDRIELYVDARDIQSEDEEGNVVLTTKELEELMRQRGLEKLEEHKRFISFDGSISDGGIQYTYKKDFYKGDYVSVVNTTLNQIVNLQIVSVTKSISNGVEYFDLTFGYDRMKVRSLKERSGSNG